MPLPTQTSKTVSGATTAPALSTDGKSTIVAAVLRAEDCCRRSLALSANLSAELERTKMLSACEEVSIICTNIQASSHPLKMQRTE